jgi:hypothetical protein
MRQARGDGFRPGCRGAPLLPPGRFMFAVRCVGMPTFQILCFQGSVLEQAEETEARDVLEAVRRVAGAPPHLKIELWSEHHQVAEIGPSPVYRPMPRNPKPRRS